MSDNYTPPTSGSSGASMIIAAVFDALIAADKIIEIIAKTESETLTDNPELMVACLSYVTHKEKARLAARDIPKDDRPPTSSPSDFGINL